MIRELYFVGGWNGETWKLGAEAERLDWGVFGKAEEAMNVGDIRQVI